MNLIILIFLTFFNRIMCQDEIRPDEFGFYFVHKPEKLDLEVVKILNNVVQEYNSFYRYTNTTLTCATVPTVTCPTVPTVTCPTVPTVTCPTQPIVTCPTVTCPPPVVMDSPCDLMPSNDPDSLGFFVSILLITLTNLGLLCFGLWKGYEMMKTKINPFKVRVDPLTK